MNNSLGAMTVKEFIGWARISKTSVYKEIKEGRLPIRKVGKRTLILVEDANQWLGNLKTVGGE